MGYHVVDPSSLDAAPGRPCVKRAVGEVAGLESVALNVYEAEPGEQVPLAYHYHDRQEEAFYVLEGELRVETPGRTYAVEADELFVADPESPHRAFVSEDGPATRVFAVGAPPVEDVHEYEP